MTLISVWAGQTPWTAPLVYQLGTCFLLPAVLQIFLMVVVKSLAET